ncbi:MAG: hypothetical protein IJ080_03575 [Oscillospiraceae bacterium]|nr:hypothetical protein [Oscillospiraceae bacterium]
MIMKHMMILLMLCLTACTVTETEKATMTGSGELIIDTAAYTDESSPAAAHCLIIRFQQGTSEEDIGSFLTQFGMEPFGGTDDPFTVRALTVTASSDEEIQTLLGEIRADERVLSAETDTGYPDNDTRQELP